MGNCAPKCTARREPIPHGMKDCGKDMPRDLPVRTELGYDLVQPGVGHLQRFVENSKTGCTHRSLVGDVYVSLFPINDSGGLWRQC